MPYFGLELFGKTITYGFGLGDLIYVCSSVIVTVILVILFSLTIFKPNPKAKLIIVTIIYLAIIFFCYSFTFGRGSEHLWNGTVFYP